METLNVLFTEDMQPAVLQVGRRVVVWAPFDDSFVDETGVSSCHDWGSWGFRKRTLHRNADGTFTLVSENLSGQGMFPEGDPDVKREHMSDLAALERSLSLGRHPHVKLYLYGEIPTHTLALALQHELRPYNDRTHRKFIPRDLHHPGQTR